MSRKRRKFTQNNSKNQLSAFGQNGFSTNSNINQVRTLENYIRYENLTLFPFPLAWLYMQEGLVRRVVQILVDDALQGGIEIEAENEEEKKEIEKAISSLNIIEEIRKAWYYARLYGGAGLLIENGQSMDMPLYNANITQYTPLRFMALTRWQLSGHQEVSLFEKLNNPRNQEYISIYGVKVHNSRILFVDGDMPPPEITGYYGGWGASVVDVIDSAVTPYIKTFSTVMELLDEAKLDVYKIDKFKTSSMSSKQRQMLLDRIQHTNSLKSMFNAVVLDTKDEFEQKKMGDVGLGVLFPEIRMRISMATNIPMSRLFGEMNKGFSSGEDDLEIYASTVESMIRSKMRPILDKILELISRNVFGELRDITYTFSPLRVLSPEKEAVVKSSIVQSISLIKLSGAISNQDYISELKAQGIFMTNPAPIDDDMAQEANEFENTLLGNGNKSFQV